MAKFSGRWLGFALIVALLALWEIASVLKWVDTFTVPRMSSVATTIWDLLRSGVLPREVGASLWRMLAGYAIGVFSGIAVGMLMGSFRTVYHLLEPLTEILRPIPSPAYVPLAILFLGIDDEMKVFMIAFASFFPVLLNTYSGVRSVDPVQLGTASTFGARGAARREDPRCGARRRPRARCRLGRARRLHRARRQAVLSGMRRRAARGARLGICRELRRGRSRAGDPACLADVVDRW